MLLTVVRVGTTIKKEKQLLFWRVDYILLNKNGELCGFRSYIKMPIAASERG